MRERNVTIRSKIWTTNIRSLGFQDTKECDIMKVDITEFRVYHYPNKKVVVLRMIIQLGGSYHIGMMIKLSQVWEHECVRGF